MRVRVLALDWAVSYTDVNTFVKTRQIVHSGLCLLLYVNFSRFSKQDLKAKSELVVAGGPCASARCRGDGGAGGGVTVCWVP